MKKILMVLMLALRLGSLAGQAADFVAGTGLEVQNPGRLRVLIERPTRDGEAIGLTYDKIDLLVSQALRRSGIAPADVKDPNAGNQRLYVNINVLGPAYTIYLSLDRTVSFRVGDRTIFSTGSSWNRSSLGTHGGKAQFILDALSGKIDSFANLYLKANGR